MLNVAVGLCDDLFHDLVLDLDRQSEHALLKRLEAAQQPVGRESQLAAALLERGLDRLDAIEHLDEVAKRLGDHDFAGIAGAAHAE